MSRVALAHSCFCLFAWLPLAAWAGGSGLNTVVVVNQASSNSLALGNAYCELRQVPPQNVLRLAWTGAKNEWTRANFDALLWHPLHALLTSRRLTNQVDFVVLSMDIPPRVTQTGAFGAGANSTTAALYYGFKTDDCPTCNPTSCSLPAPSSNSYAGSEAVFRAARPATATSNALLAFMLTATNYDEALRILQRGVASDGTFPTQRVWLAKGSDVYRNIRYLQFDDALFNARLLGRPNLARTNNSTPNGLTNLAGYLNGMYQFNIRPDCFAPGALADSLTSYAGRIFENNDHTTLLRFLNAGAVASHGTVVEPCAWLGKFSSPQIYFYQARGFSAAECYYLGLTNPYQGLLIGEPLAAPFARRPAIAWTGLPEGARLAGTTNLTLQVSAADAQRPVGQVDLFLDGLWARTLTNIGPRQGNQLLVTLAGRAMSYTVPAGATLASVTAGLTAELNQPANTNVTKVLATAHGDRIELQGLALATPDKGPTLSAGSAVGSGGILTTFITASTASLLDSEAFGLRGWEVTNTPALGSFLRLTITKTNGAVVTVAVTNNTSTGTVSSVTQQLVDAVNAQAELQDPDGLLAEDFIGGDVWGLPQSEFNLRARSAGWPAAQIQAALTGSAVFKIGPAGTQRLDANLSDLRPRAHLYLAAGLTNFALAFPLNTTTNGEGWRELTAVAYEGTHVRTQQRAARGVVVTNSPLAATLTLLQGGSNTLLGSTLEFGVAANTGNIARLELFSTGGAWGFVNGQSHAVFSVAGTNLGAGLHPFYALVTPASGQPFRTETRWVRLVTGPEPPFALGIKGPPPELTWPVTVGRTYEVYGTAVPLSNLTLRATLTPSNSPARWTDPAPDPERRAYRVRALP